MTEQDVPIVADIIRRAVDAALMQERALGKRALDAVQDAIGARLASLEARPVPDPLPDPIVALKGLIEPLAGRLEALEARAAIPGPPGKPGLAYCGVFVAGKTYEKGDCVTYAGSLWHCDADATTTRPGDGAPGWTLTVKRGRDGKDGRP